MELVLMSLMLLVGANAQRGGIISSLVSDPCIDACGPNTFCSVTSQGIAQCRCHDGFVPNGNTIIGCKPQCTRDNDCPYDYRCQATKCVRVCQAGACGINAECDARYHRAICKCPRGYQGRAEIRCTKSITIIDPPDIIDTRTGPPSPTDLCQPNPCGENAECRPGVDRPVCTCPIGYEGNPLNYCRKGECIVANDCSGRTTCQKLRCIDPCNIPNICGINAECQTIDHQPICSCRSGMVGDPFIKCKDPEELCRPSPCGRNTNCQVRNNRAVCTCIENYLGDPLSATGCRTECVFDTECPTRMACENNKCVNPCINACGEDAICDVIQGRAKCSCPEFYEGNPLTRCYPECTVHSQCPHYQACHQLKCVDPCEGQCGVNAECKVVNHNPVCSCPKGFTGHPFDSCRISPREELCSPNPCGQGADCTPGFDRNGNDRPVCTCPHGFIGNPLISCKRRECEDHEHCRYNQACYAHICQNPCYAEFGGSVCGDNAECTVKNHQPVCSCPPGLYGNPLIACYRRSSRASKDESGEEE